MSRRKKATGRSMRRCTRKKPTSQGFYTPFENLDQHLARNRSKAPPASKERAVAVPATDESRDEDLFREAMSGVSPLSSKKERIPPPRPTQVPPRFFTREEWEAYMQLVDLVNGDAPFELSCSDEYMEGFISGLSPEVLKKLRQGELSYQAHMDLHGCNRHQAKEMVATFIQKNFSLGRRCVLIVSGRGLNSKERQPILKHSLVTWLTRAPLKRLVLAFASARPRDGGAGAFYVVLRRNEGKAPFVSSDNG